MKPSRISKQRLAVVGAVVLVPAALVAQSGAAAPPQTSAAQPTTFTLVERGGTFKFIDEPPRGGHFTTGDQLVLTETLYRSGERVGTLHGVCEVTRRTAFNRTTPLLCNGYVKLQRGSLSLQAVVHGGPPEKIAITGGTGRYAGATGVMTERRSAAGPNVLRVRIF